MISSLWYFLDREAYFAQLTLDNTVGLPSHHTNALREWQSLNCFHLNINNNHYGRRFSSVGWAGDHMPRALKRPPQFESDPWPLAACLPLCLSLRFPVSLRCVYPIKPIKLKCQKIYWKIKSLCNTGVKDLEWIPSCIRCLCKISCTFVVSLSSNAKLATLLLPTCCWGSSRWWGCT